mmetsp:Transcript_15013/g.30972  ORF Transcript_15013/g.30972 Transcript_15013/m.30972 type:complete len:174 (+) Transcript_15013:1195-1716(+)
MSQRLTRGFDGRVSRCEKMDSLIILSISEGSVSFGMNLLEKDRDSPTERKKSSYFIRPSAVLSLFSASCTHDHGIPYASAKINPCKDALDMALHLVNADRNMAILSVLMSKSMKLSSTTKTGSNGVIGKFEVCSKYNLEVLDVNLSLLELCDGHLQRDVSRYQGQFHHQGLST